MNLLKKSEFKKTLIKDNSNISDAIKSLNNSGLKIALVLKKNKFTGYVCHFKPPDVIRTSRS